VHKDNTRVSVSSGLSTSPDHSHDLGHGTLLSESQMPCAAKPSLIRRLSEGTASSTTGEPVTPVNSPGMPTKLRRPLQCRRPCRRETVPTPKSRSARVGGGFVPLPSKPSPQKPRSKAPLVREKELSDNEDNSVKMPGVVPDEKAVRGQRAHRCCEQSNLHQHHHLPQLPARIHLKSKLQSFPKVLLVQNTTLA